MCTEKVFEYAGLLEGEPGDWMSYHVNKYANIVRLSEVCYDLATDPITYTVNMSSRGRRYQYTETTS
jgi:hypothetical protein